MQGWDDLYLNPINEGFLDKAKEAHALEAEAKVEEHKRVRDEALAQHVLLGVRDEALAQHVLLTGAVIGFQEPAAAPQGLVEVHSASHSAVLPLPLPRLSHVCTLITPETNPSCSRPAKQEQGWSETAW